MLVLLLVAASDLINDVEFNVSNVSAFVAVPLNTAFVTVVLIFKPGPIVANPEIAAAGVNVASLDQIPQITLLTYICTTTWSLAPLSVIVVTIAPDVPSPLVDAGPMVTNALPLYAFN